MDNNNTAGRRRTRQGRGITDALKSTIIDRVEEEKRVLSPFRPPQDVVQQRNSVANGRPSLIRGPEQRAREQSLGRGITIRNGNNALQTARASGRGILSDQKRGMQPDETKRSSQINSARGGEPAQVKEAKQPDLGSNIFKSLNEFIAGSMANNQRAQAQTKLNSARDRRQIYEFQKNRTVENPFQQNRMSKAEIDNRELTNRESNMSKNDAKDSSSKDGLGFKDEIRDRKTYRQMIGTTGLLENDTVHSSGGKGTITQKYSTPGLFETAAIFVSDSNLRQQYYDNFLKDDGTTAIKKQQTIINQPSRYTTFLSPSTKLNTNLGATDNFVKKTFIPRRDYNGGKDINQLIRGQQYVHQEDAHHETVSEQIKQIASIDKLKPTGMAERVYGEDETPDGESMSDDERMQPQLQPVIQKEMATSISSEEDEESMESEPSYQEIMLATQTEPDEEIMHIKKVSAVRKTIFWKKSYKEMCINIPSPVYRIKAYKSKNYDQISFQLPRSPTFKIRLFSQPHETFEDSHPDRVDAYHELIYLKGEYNIVQLQSLNAVKRKVHIKQDHQVIQAEKIDAVKGIIERHCQTYDDAGVLFPPDKQAFNDIIETELEVYEELNKIPEVYQPATEIVRCCGVRFLIEKKFEKPKPRLSWTFLILLTMICAFSAMQFGGATMNQQKIQNILLAQLTPEQVDNDQQVEIYFIIGPAIGVCIGAAASGKLMSYGRKWILVGFNLIGITGSILSILSSYKLIILGRTIYGIGAGGLISVAPRMIQETIPNELFDKGFSATTNTAIDIFVLFNTLMMSFMPQYPIETKEELKHSHLWRIIYFIPIPLMFFALVLSIFMMKTDTIGYWVQKKNKEKCIEALSQVYLFEEDEQYEKRYNDTLSILDKDPDAFDPHTDINALKHQVDHQQEKTTEGIDKVKDEGADAEKNAEEKEKEAKDKAKKEAEDDEKKVDETEKKDEDKAKKDVDNDEKKGKDVAKKEVKKGEKKVEKKVKDEEKKVETKAKDIANAAGGNEVGNDYAKEQKETKEINHKVDEHDDHVQIEDKDHVRDNVTYNLKANTKQRKQRTKKQNNDFEGGNSENESDQGDDDNCDDKKVDKEASEDEKEMTAEEKELMDKIEKLKDEFEDKVNGFIDEMKKKVEKETFGKIDEIKEKSEREVAVKVRQLENKLDASINKEVKKGEGKTKKALDDILKKTKAECDKVLNEAIKKVRAESDQALNEVTEKIKTESDKLLTETMDTIKADSDKALDASIKTVQADSDKVLNEATTRITSEFKDKPELDAKLKEAKDKAEKVLNAQLKSAKDAAEQALNAKIKETKASTEKELNNKLQTEKIKAERELDSKLKEVKYTSTQELNSKIKEAKTAFQKDGIDKVNAAKDKFESGINDEINTFKNKEEAKINKVIAKLQADSEKMITKETNKIKMRVAKLLNDAIKLLKAEQGKAKKEADKLLKDTGLTTADVGEAVGLYDALFHGDYRQGTWMCILLGIFNQMTGIVTLLIYLPNIVVLVGKVNHEYQLNEISMTYYLMISLLMGASMANFFVYKFKRKTIFIAGFSVILVCLCLTALFIELRMGAAVLPCLCALQFTLQIISAPLYIYQTEVLVDQALGLSNSIKSAVFVGQQIVLNNLVTGGAKAYFQCTLPQIFYFFGAIQIIAITVIAWNMRETKGLTDAQKRDLCNPTAQQVYAEIEEKKEEAEEPEAVGEWHEVPFVKKEFMLQKKMNKFVADVFTRFQKSAELDKITIAEAQIYIFDLMYRYKLLNQWDNDQFKQMYSFMDTTEDDEMRFNSLNAKQLGRFVKYYSQCTNIDRSSLACR